MARKHADWAQELLSVSESHWDARMAHFCAMEAAR